MTVAVPAMAAMQRSHGGLQDTYVHWLRRVALTICPIAAGLVGASYEVVGVLYGRRLAGGSSHSPLALHRQPAAARAQHSQSGSTWPADADAGSFGWE